MNSKASGAKKVKASARDRSLVIVGNVSKSQIVISDRRAASARPTRSRVASPRRKKDGKAKTTRPSRLPGRLVVVEGHRGSSGMTPFDVTVDGRCMERARLRPEILPEVTLRRLGSALLKRSAIWVVHYAGHAAADSDSIYLTEPSEGSSGVRGIHAVEPEALMREMKGPKLLPLVFFNACHSSGLARRVVESRVARCAIGIQGEWRASLASELAGHFYERFREVRPRTVRGFREALEAALSRGNFSQAARAQVRFFPAPPAARGDGRLAPSSEPIPGRSEDPEAPVPSRRSPPPGGSPSLGPDMAKREPPLPATRAAMKIVRGASAAPGSMKGMESESDPGPTPGKARLGSTTPDGSAGPTVRVGNVEAGAGAVVQVVGPGGQASVVRGEDLQQQTARKVLKAYGNFLRGECDKVWEPGKGIQKRRLLQVYAAMRAIPTEFLVPNEPADGPGPGIMMAGPEEDAEADGEVLPVERLNRVRVPIPPVLDLASKATRLALLGPPGGGKSTFLRYLALTLADRWDPNPGAPEGGATSEPWEARGLGELSGFVPVWIELRELRWPKTSNPLRWPRLWAAHLAALAAASNAWVGAEWKDVEAFLCQSMREGRLLFLLDGLDEVTRLDEDAGGEGEAVGLESLQEAIRELLAWRPPGRAGERQRHRVLVTCREVSWNDDWKIAGWVDGSEDGAGAMVATLEPFDESERKGFLAAWFNSWERAKVVHGHLQDPVRNWGGRLEEMASVPLNLTMIAWLVDRRLERERHRGRVASAAAWILPATRAAIYEQVVYAILWDIDDEKSEVDDPRKPREQVEKTLSALVGGGADRRQQFVQALASVAFRSLDGGNQAQLKRSWLEKTLGSALFGRLWRLKAGRVSDILQTMQCRSGILRLENPAKDAGVEDDRYGFVHRSFWEYLAALHLVAGPPASSCAERDTADEGKDGSGDIGRRGLELLDRGATWSDRGTGPSERDAHTVRELSWEPFRLAAGYFGVAPEDRKPLLAGGETREPATVEVLVHALLGRWPRRPHDVWLAGDLALLAGLIRRGSLRSLHDALVETMQSEGLLEKERAEVGRILGQLGDLRPGVAPVNDPVRDPLFFAWSELIRKGTAFQMGGDKHASHGEHSVERFIEEDYRIARYPVTQAQYEHFEKSPYFGRHAKTRGWRVRDKADPRFNGANQPVVNVQWGEAVGFCEWINSLGLSGKQLGIEGAKPGQHWEVRLPHEWEWELAARGNEGRWLPWVERRGPGKVAPKPAHCDLEGRCNWGESGIGATSPVGMYPGGKSWCGAEDLIGNVWEWTRTAWRETPDGADDGGSLEESTEERRVLRGGSWVDHDPENLRCASRGGNPPRLSFHFFGFRVVCVRVLASVG